MHAVPSPDLVIFLDAPFELLRENIRKRGRTMESGLGDHYLKNLAMGYEKLIEKHEGRAIRIDLSNVLTNYIDKASKLIVEWLENKPTKGLSTIALY